METEIGAFDADTRTVPVTFTQGGASFARSVNAVVNSAGEYDEAATADRVAQVALGVAYKFDAGLIPASAPEIDTETPATVAADD